MVLTLGVSACGQTVQGVGKDIIDMGQSVVDMGKTEKKSDWCLNLLWEWL